MLLFTTTHVDWGNSWDMLKGFLNLAPPCRPQQLLLLLWMQQELKLVEGQALASPSLGPTDQGKKA